MNSSAILLILKCFTHDTDPSFTFIENLKRTMSKLVTAWHLLMFLGMYEQSIKN